MSAAESSVLGGGGSFVGQDVYVQDGPLNFTINGQEYLRKGTIKAYSAAYANAVAAMPQLRVFGTAANTQSTFGYGVSGGSFNYTYLAGNYIAYATAGTSNYMPQYGATLATAASTACTTSGSNTQAVKHIANSGTYIVMPASSANLAPIYTAGTAFANVGGTFTTFNQGHIAFGNNSWLSVADLNGTAGSLGYIANANPSGAWTVATPTNLGITGIAGLAYGNGKFVAAASNASMISGQIAYCTTAGGAWTAASLPNPTSVGISLQDLVFDGTAHIALASGGAIYTSTDGGVNWTRQSNLPAVSTTFTRLSTDGAGTVIANSSSTVSATVNAVMAISTDHGVTWTAFQATTGLTMQSAQGISYANGQWLYCASNNAGQLTAIPNFTTPDYIGLQTATASTPNYVRIK